MRKNSIKINIENRNWSILQSKVWLVLLMMVVLFSSCTSLQESPKYQFSEGIYRAKIDGERVGEVYVDMIGDSLILSPVVSDKGGVQLDTAGSIVLNIAEEKKAASRSAQTFAQPSFDLDVLTIPFKYRPAAGGIPRQLNTAFQGALYIGLRRDIFRVSYKETPLGNYRRSLNHFGYSAGFFSGLGSSTINEFVTQNQVEYEYEGVLFLNGVAAIVGINNFTFGLTVGLDHLLDRNRSSWIYQHKPWVGLALGLNLN